jgi:hypothetical protein
MLGLSWRFFTGQEEEGGGSKKLPSRTLLSECFPTLGKLADSRRAASVALQRASVSWRIYKRAFEVMYIFRLSLKYNSWYTFK